MTIPGRYDALNAVIFLGRSRRLRRRLVDALGVGPGHEVLELGCGSGQVTEALEAAGAHVTAVDALDEMIERARQRAPRAAFQRGDLRELEVDGPFDRAVLSFVLHNLSGAERVRVLRGAERVLTSGGLVGILDWAQPRGRIRQRLWRAFVGRIEPSPTGGEIMDGALPADLAAAGLEITAKQSVVGGRAQIIVAGRAAAAC